MAYLRQSLFDYNGLLAARLPLQGRRDTNVDFNSNSDNADHILRYGAGGKRADALETSVQAQWVVHDT